MSTKKSVKKAITISVSYVIYAKPSDVFDALTKATIIEKWCDGGGSVELKEKGKVELFGGWVKGSVIEFSKKEKSLRYTWKPSEWDKKSDESVVQYFLKTHPAGTEVLIEHSGFPNQTEADKHLSGWTDYVFEPLNDYFVP